MKVRYIGENSDWLQFIHNKVYDKIGEAHGMWRVIDETGEDYLYLPGNFEALSEEEYEALMQQPEYRPHTCPICGKTEFSMKQSGELCRICGWFDFPEWNHADEKTYKELYDAGKISYGDWSALKNN